MSKFRNREEFEEWAYDQFVKYGIKQPDTFGDDVIEELVADD